MTNSTTKKNDLQKVHPPSPTGTESTNEDEGFNKLRSKRIIFGASGNLFRILKESTLLRKLPSPTNFDTSNQLPFNKLEFGLFAQNCFLYMFGDERESNRLDTLLSVAILILLYFIVIQNLFQGRTTKKELATVNEDSSHN